METVVKALYNASFAIWNTLIGIAMTIFRTSPTAVSVALPMESCIHFIQVFLQRPYRLPPAFLSLPSISLW